VTTFFLIEFLKLWALFVSGFEEDGRDTGAIFLYDILPPRHLSSTTSSLHDIFLSRYLPFTTSSLHDILPPRHSPSTTSSYSFHDVLSSHIKEKMWEYDIVAAYTVVIVVPEVKVPWMLTWKPVKELPWRR